MGNTPSYEGPFADVELAALAAPLVVFDKRFVSGAGGMRLRMDDSSSTSKSLAFKDATSREVLFRTGADVELRTLLDADKKPIATLATKGDISRVFYAYRPETAPAMTAASNGFVVDASDESELLQIYVKLGELTKTAYLPTDLRVDFRDAATGERCKVEMEGEWRARSAVLWLERRSSGVRTLIARVFRSKGALRSDFFVEVVPNVDLALVVLALALADDVLKKERRLARFGISPE
ncbi:hypothetical protein PybrP1_012588 [[Pythium] brassicae (nom. inval.)]|nr:hypothetical protein PybrP1_012588 [[Pythium] brassicae (nom. inval.)]